MNMPRRDFLATLSLSFAAPFLVKMAPVLASDSDLSCVVEVEVRFPKKMSRSDFDYHHAQMEKNSAFCALNNEFIGQLRLRRVDQSFYETHSVWRYEFANAQAYNDWSAAVAERGLVNKTYLDKSFTWITRQDGRVIKVS